MALLGLVACGGDTRPTIMIDASTADSGPVGPADSGPRIDSGTPDTCPAAQSMMPTADQCAAATLTCLMAAGGDAAAQQACIDGDPMPMPCLSCLSGEFTYTCSDTDICGDEFGEVICCITDECSSASDRNACIEAALAAGGACGSLVTEFEDCSDTAAAAGQCGISNEFCFAAATGFFPDYSARRVPQIEFSPAAIRAAIARR